MIEENQNYICECEDYPDCGHKEEDRRTTITERKQEEAEFKEELRKEIKGY
jgi:hypothetical protein